MKDTIFAFGPFTLDTGQVLLKKDEKRVPIRPQTLSALIYLVENRDRVVTREDLYAKLWPGNNIAEDQSLNVVIKNLREILKDNSKNPLYIETIPRRGYRFVAQPKKEVSQEPKFRAGFRLLASAFVVGIVVLGAAVVPNLFDPGKGSLGFMTKKDISVAARTQLVLGEQQINDGNFEAGRKVFEEIVTANPDFAEGYLWLARSWSWVPGLRLEGAEKAKGNYLKAIELNPNYEEALAELGAIYLVTDLNATEAARLGNQIRTRDSRNPKAYMLLGMAELARGRPEKAVEVFEEVSLIDPTLLNFSARVGWTYYMAGRFQEAAQLCRVLVQTLEEAGWARTCLFESYLALEEFDLAEIQAIELLKEGGLDEAEAKKILGEETGSWLKNFDEWELKIYKEMEKPPYYNQAFVELRLGDLDAAFKDLQEVVKQRHFPYFVTLNSDPRLVVFRDRPDADTVFLEFK